METWKIITLVVVISVLLCSTWYGIKLSIKEYKNKLWVHLKTGDEYMPTEICMMKNPTNGEWVKAVIYKKDDNVYVREREDFLDKFVKLTKYKNNGEKE